MFIILAIASIITIAVDSDFNFTVKKSIITCNGNSKCIKITDKKKVNIQKGSSK